jgi:hypothetical protein
MLQENPHALAAHLGCPFVTVGHALPHVMQLPAFVDVSTHEPVHSVGVALGQPDAHV